MNPIPAGSADIVEAIARANHAPFTRNAYAASVTVGDATYWWAAA